MVNEIKKIAGKTIINEKLLGTGENAIKLQPSSEASGNNSVAEGYNTISIGNNSHTEGFNTLAGQKGFLINKTNSSAADKKYKLSSVDGLQVNDYVSIIEGDSTEDFDFQYLDFGKITEINTTNLTITVDTYQDIQYPVGYLFVKGKNIGDVVICGNSHAEGKNTSAFGMNSHAEGFYTRALGEYSHVEGRETIASGENQHVEGKFNIEDTNNKYAHIVGNGNDEEYSNAHTLDWEGNAHYAGDVYANTTYDSNGIPTGKKLATVEYVDNNTGGAEGEPTYQSVTLNTEISGIKNGLAKFKFTGLVQPGQYNLAHGQLSDKYIPLQHTMGNICVYQNDLLIDTFSIDLFGRNENTTRNFSEAKNELTEKYYKRVWSNDFFISKSFEYAQVSTKNANKILHKITIPISDFGDEIPKQTGVLECICPAGYPRTVTELTETSSAVGTIYPYFAMEYSEDKQNVYLYILTGSAYDKKEYIFNTKLYIKYELENPIYDYHNFKLYLTNGMKITFSQESAFNTEELKQLLTYTAVPSAANENLSGVPLTATINAPINSSAILEGFEQTSININDLNKRVDNIKVTTAKLGAADGVTDDSDAIQYLINNCANTDGSISEVQIPTGIYALGKSLEITTSNVKLVGLGNVILKPTGNFPAIKIYKKDNTALRDIYVDNIKIYLPDAAYLDTDNYKGSHSGIYIDGSNNGIYRVNLSNITVQGVYRYKIRNSDNSYGIYFNDNIQDSSIYGFVYFPTLTNIQCFSVYCGLYLGKYNNCATVTNFHFDSGVDIYGKGLRPFKHFGCAYGIICNSNYNTIDLTGQLIGHDQGGFVYFDENRNEYSLTDVIGEENVIHGDAKYEEDILDFFSSDYITNDGVKQEVVYTDSEGNNINLTLGYVNLSKTGILCSGSCNTFSGMIFDAQRAYSYIDFTSGSSKNRYYIPTLYMNYGKNTQDSSSYLDLNGNGILDDIEKTKTFTISYIFIDDKGTDNICVDPVQSQAESLAGEEFISSADENGSVIGHSVHHGFQDNCLSYLDKESTITVKQGETDVTINDGAILASEAMKEVFDPESISYGFTQGITFDQIPTVDNPIEILIEFNSDFTISRLSRFDIKFNNYIAKQFSVSFNYEGHNYTRTSIAAKYNTNSLVSTLLYFYKDKDSENIEKITNVKGIKIRIFRGYSIGNYNPEGKVGLSYIFGVDSEHGGNTFLTKSGGKLYGDLSINDSKVATEEYVNTINNASFDELCGNKTVESETNSIMVTDHLKEKSIVNYQIYGNSTQETRSGKNILPYPYVETTKTENDITFTDNGDGTITINGTASADTTFNLCTNVNLTAETYTFSGCPSSGSATTYFISGFTGTDAGSGFTITLDSDTTDTLSIIIKSGTTVSNIVFKPQIEVGSSVTEYEQYGAMPSPDFPSEIQSVGDLVTNETSEYYGKYDIPIPVIGKNLIPYPYYTEMPCTYSGITYTLNEDRSISATGIRTSGGAITLANHVAIPNADSLYFDVKFLYSSSNILVSIYLYDEDDTLLYSKGDTDTNNRRIALSEYPTAKYFSILVKSNTPVDASSRFLVSVSTSQITEYEPYTGEIKHIYLNEPLRKVGDYADYIDYKNQKVIRNVEVLDDTGTKSIEESFGILSTQTEENITMPELITPNSTVLNVSVNTDLLPSKINLTYYQDIDIKLSDLENNYATKEYVDNAIVLPTAKTAIVDPITVNTIYDLGVQTAIDITLPSGKIGDFIQFDFVSGETATTLSVSSTNGLIGYDLIPEVNKIYSLYFDWGVAGYDGTNVSYGWRFNYSEYSI